MKNIENMRELNEKEIEKVAGGWVIDGEDGELPPDDDETDENYDGYDAMNEFYGLKWSN